jgi:hypothetical protein
MADPEVVKLQAQLHKIQGQLTDCIKERDAFNKGANTRVAFVCLRRLSTRARAARVDLFATLQAPHPPSTVYLVPMQSSAR